FDDLMMASQIYTKDLEYTYERRMELYCPELSQLDSDNSDDLELMIKTLYKTNLHHPICNMMKNYMCACCIYYKEDEKITSTYDFNDDNQENGILHQCRWYISKHAGLPSTVFHYKLAYPDWENQFKDSAQLMAFVN